MNTQPERSEKERPVRVERKDGEIIISVEYINIRDTLRMSEHNAWRVFGMLALLLGIPLADRVKKAITF